MWPHLMWPLLVLQNPRHHWRGDHYVEVLVHANLSRYFWRFGGNLHTSDESWVDQACRHPRCVSLQSQSDEGADKLRCLPYFLARKRSRLSTPSCHRPTTLYKVVQRLEWTYAMSHQCVAGANTLLHPFLGIPLSSASLTMCRPAQGCNASIPPLGSLFYAGSSLVPVPGNSFLKARHRPLLIPYKPRVSKLFAASAVQNHDYRIVRPHYRCRAWRHRTWCWISHRGPYPCKSVQNHGRLFCKWYKKW